MKRSLFAVMCLALQSGFGPSGCTSSQDSSTGDDGGPDSEWDADAGCGITDVVCCDTAPVCADGHVSVTTDETDCWCYAACTLAMCEDADETWATDVACQDIGGGLGACMAAEDLVTGQDCGEVGATCTTISGYDGNCLSDGTIEYCLAGCTPIADTGCDIVHTCLPLISTSTGVFGGAACIPSS